MRNSTCGQHQHDFSGQVIPQRLVRHSIPEVFGQLATFAHGFADRHACPFDRGELSAPFFPTATLVQNKHLAIVFFDQKPHVFILAARARYKFMDLMSFRHERTPQWS